MSVENLISLVCCKGLGERLGLKSSIDLVERTQKETLRWIHGIRGELLVLIDDLQLYYLHVRGPLASAQVLVLRGAAVGPAIASQPQTGVFALVASRIRVFSSQAIQS
jgi:hypothetical protein